MSVPEAHAGWFDPWAIPLVGRDATLAACKDAVSSRVGCLMVAGERMVGTTRVAFELMRWIEASGARVIWAESDGDDPAVRLREALAAAERNGDDPAAASTPFAVFAGDRDDDRLLGVWAREFGGTDGVVICTGRESAAATVARVDPLGGDGIRMVARSVVPDIDDERSDRVVELSDGLPGCAVALAPSATSAPFALPGALADLVDARLRGLGAAVLEVARWAAVLERFDVSSVAAMTDRAIEETASDVDQLIGLRVVRPDGGQGALSFVHRLTRQSLVADVRIGGGATRVLRSTPTDVGPSDRRSRLLIQRLRLADAAHEERSWPAAVRQTTLGLAESGPVDDLEVRSRLWLARGKALESLVRLPDAMEAFSAAKAGFVELGDSRSHEHCHVRLEAVRSRRLARSVSEGTTSESPCSGGAAGDDVEHAFGLWRRLQFADATALAGEVLARPRDELSLDDRQKVSFVRADSTAFLSPSRSNIARLGELRAEALRDGHAHVAANAATGEMVLLGDCYGDLAEAEAIARETRSELSRRGAEAEAGLITIALAYMLGDAGRLDDMRREIDRLKASEPDYGALGLGDAIEIGFARRVGRFDAVAALARPMLLEDVRLRMDAQIMLATEYLLCRPRQAEPDRAVLAKLEEALTFGDGTPGPVIYKLFLLVAAVESGLASAHAIWAGELDRLAEWDAPRVDAMRGLAEGFAAGGEHEARDAFRRAAASFESLGVGWWAARAWLAAGEGSGADDASADLDRARAAFAAMGADGWRERAEAALRTRGRRWSSRRRGVNDALSGREIEIMRLLQGGMTNLEMARQLVLSENTVARHLTRIYRKLGVGNRREAQRAFERPSAPA